MPRQTCRRHEVQSSRRRSRHVHILARHAHNAVARRRAAHAVSTYFPKETPVDAYGLTNVVLVLPDHTIVAHDLPNHWLNLAQGHATRRRHSDWRCRRRTAQPARDTHSALKEPAVECLPACCNHAFCGALLSSSFFPATPAYTCGQTAGGDPRVLHSSPEVPHHCTRPLRNRARGRSCCRILALAHSPHIPSLDQEVESAFLPIRAGRCGSALRKCQRHNVPKVSQVLIRDRQSRPRTRRMMSLRCGVLSHSTILTLCRGIVVVVNLPRVTWRARCGSATVCVPAGHEPGGWNIAGPSRVARCPACSAEDRLAHRRLGDVEMMVASQNASSWSQGVAGWVIVVVSRRTVDAGRRCLRGYSPAPPKSIPVAGSESSSFVPRRPCDA